MELPNLEFIVDAKKGTEARSFEAMPTGWEDVVFALEDVPATRPAAA